MHTKIISTLLIYATFACGGIISQNESSSPSYEKTSDWKTLSKKNYSIQYPANWELDESGQLGISFIVFSPLENEDDRFKENINLMIQDLSAHSIDLNKFVEISEEQVKTMITNSNLIESTRIKGSNPEFHKMIYSGDQGVYQLKFEQYYWIINQKAYILTLTCENANFLLYQEIGEKILNSFVIKT